MTETSRLNDLEPYIPSSSEKKQAVMMYMVVWLILSMWKREVSPYTHHHMKQSLGWLVFLVLIIFTDLVLIFLWMLLKLFSILALLISIPALTVWAMGIYQAWKWKYVRESESVNKFFQLFSGIWNWVLNLFETNHYQIIDANNYRAAEQYYSTSAKKIENNTEEQKTETFQWVTIATEIWTTPVTQDTELKIESNTETSSSENSKWDWNLLDNNQEISINNSNIWVDLSNHEINNPENQINI